MRRFLFSAAGLALLTTSGTALAQQPPPTDSNVSLNAPGLLLKKPPPGLPPVKAQPLAWPRLDAGSVLCRTEDDLDRLASRRRGDPAGGPVDCQILRAPTPIAIVQRKAPAKTEVKTADQQGGGSGWTDVWLPEKAPPLGATARR